jgi:hypothetical protein
MSLPSGERTFFSYGGANNEFAPEHIDISELKCKILHIGYILLLDSFDAKDDEYGTVMARFLKAVKEKGAQQGHNKGQFGKKFVHKTPNPGTNDKNSQNGEKNKIINLPENRCISGGFML